MLLIIYQPTPKTIFIVVTHTSLHPRSQMMLIAETYVFSVVNVLPKILLAVTNTDVAETFAEQDIFFETKFVVLKNSNSFF
jgi:hypothetical protein